MTTDSEAKQLLFSGRIKLAILRERSVLAILMPGSLFILALLLSYFNLTEGHNWGDDFSQYLAQARAIVDGSISQQLAANRFILEHSQSGFAATAYPWGTSLLLAPIYWCFGFNLFVFKMVGVLFFGLSAATIYLFFLQRTSRSWAFLLTTLFAANPILVGFTDSILSDLPFLFFSTACLICLDGLFKQTGIKAQIAFGAGAGLLATFAFLCRTNGLILLMTLFCRHILLLLTKLFPDNKLLNKMIQNNSQANALAHFLPYLVFWGLFGIISRFLPGGGESHLNNLISTNLASILSNIDYYIRTFGQFFGIPANLAYITFILAMPLFIYGIILYFSRETIALVYLSGTMLLYLIWSGQQGIRFLFPILPLVILFIFLGAREFLKRFKYQIQAKLIAKTLAFSICLLMLAGSSSMAITNILAGRAWNDQAYSKSALDTYQYIIGNTSPEAKIIFFKPRVLWLNTGRIGFNIGDDLNRVGEGDYVLLTCNEEDDISRNFTASSFPGGNIQLKPVFAEGEFTLYQIIRE
jgi:hypothetical protein